MNPLSPALEIDTLTVHYDTNLVLDSVSLHIMPGQVVGIIGPNGAGKSTLIKAILRLIPSAGTVKIYGSSEVAATKYCAYVPQRASIDWQFPISVFDVVLMGCYARLGWLRRPSQSDKEQAMFALHQVGMQDFPHRSIGQLSGGQQQRVFLARALLQDTPLLILDEPCNGIDMHTQQLIMNKLSELASAGKTILIVHHDLSHAFDYFTHSVLLNKLLVAYGPTKDIFTPALLEKTYGIPLIHTRN